MDGRIIQGIVASTDPKEAGALLEGLLAHARHSLQRFTVLERTMLGTIVDNVAGQRRAKAGNIGEQVLACRIYVDAYQVDAALHRLVEAPFQGSLVYVVLVLPYANTLGIDLHQLGQRIH